VLVDPAARAAARRSVRDEGLIGLVTGVRGGELVVDELLEEIGSRGSGVVCKARRLRDLPSPHRERVALGPGLRLVPDPPAARKGGLRVEAAREAAARPRSPTRHSSASCVTTTFPGRIFGLSVSVRTVHRE
jgi:hypothetical protein